MFKKKKLEDHSLVGEFNNQGYFPRELRILNITTTTTTSRLLLVMLMMDEGV